MQTAKGNTQRHDMETIPHEVPTQMTTETQEAILAHSVYSQVMPAGYRVCWSGAVNNVQFDIVRRGDVVYLVFAGTNEWADMWRHVWVRRETIGDGIKVHRGWLADWQRCIPVVYSVLKDQMELLPRRLVVLGHSYGGSLAQIAAWYLSHEYGAPRVDLRTYGSPRAGNAGFAKDLDRRTESHYRYVTRLDPVTQTPLAIRYWHGGTKILMPFHRSPHSMAGYLKAINGDYK